MLLVLSRTPSQTGPIIPLLGKVKWIRHAVSVTHDLYYRIKCAELKATGDDEVADFFFANASTPVEETKKKLYPDHCGVCRGYLEGSSHEGELQPSHSGQVFHLPSGREEDMKTTDPALSILKLHFNEETMVTLKHKVDRLAGPDFGGREEAVTQTVEADLQPVTVETKTESVISKPSLSLLCDKLFKHE